MREVRVVLAIAAIFAIAVLILGGLLGKDRLEVLTSSEPYKATYIECDWVDSYNTPKTRTWFSKPTNYYQPIAVSKEGYRAVGRLKMSTNDRFKPSAQDNCRRLIGHEVTILVNKDRPEEARIYTFYQFWLAPFMLLSFILIFIALFLGAKKTQVSITIGMLIVLAASYVSEFKYLHDTPITPNLKLIDANVTLESCINETMPEEKVKEPYTLEHLNCPKKPPQ